MRAPVCGCFTEALPAGCGSTLDSAVSTQSEEPALAPEFTSRRRQATLTSTVCACRLGEGGLRRCYHPAAAAGLL